LFGGPVRKQESALTQQHKDIAAALQLITEEVMFKILRHVHSVVKKDAVVLAGGVALNSVCNGKILRNTPFKQIWIQPNASDGGTSIGAAAYIYHALLRKPRSFVQTHVYLGPAFTAADIKQFLDSNKIHYHTFVDRETLIATTAKLLVKNNVIGWFQGHMEWGPRALGARSILSNPCHKSMKRILNKKVKHREGFRPFAPVVCAEDAPAYFDCDVPLSPATDFMLMVYPIKKEWQARLPAVTHVDGSGRLQTIRREQNPLYYDLIKSFGAISGVPILVNTSFNIRGEPIVCTPQDAYKCMMGTGIDYLVMGTFLIKRADNPQDIWDSEKQAKD